MITTLLIAGAVLSVALSGLFSGTETGIYCLNRVRLRLHSEQGRPSARRVDALLRRPNDLIITVLIGTTIADYCASVCVAALLLRAVTGRQAEIYTAMIMTPMIFVFGNAIPKNWFQRGSDRFMYPLSWILERIVQAARLTGAIWILGRLTRLVVRIVDPSGAARREDVLPRAITLHILREGAARRGLTAAQSDMIERVMRLSEVRVGRVMIPRQRAAIIREDISRDDFLRIASMAHFSRFPMSRGGETRMCGVVNAYDVLTDEQQRPVREYARATIELRPDEPVSAALVKMQNARQAMAIVVDRSGECLGVLTIKDLVEEIVGDLAAW